MEEQNPIPRFVEDADDLEPFMTPAACPFCNGILPTLGAPPTESKLPCPRCGEAVPAARWQIDPSTALREGPPPVKPEPAAPIQEGPGKRKTALVIVGIMAAMAIIGLGYALWTTPGRQARHPWMPTQVEPIALRRPLELTGLGYLPKECRFVAGLHIAELHEDKLGKQLLEEPRPFLMGWIVNQIPRTTGMKLDQIDHVVVGSTLDMQSLQLIVVVKTRQNYSREKIVDAIQPRKGILYEEEPLYEFELKSVGDAFLWCVEDRTLVYVIRVPGDPPTREHLRGLSKAPRRAEEVLSPPLHEALKDRLNTHNLLWAAGRLDQLGAAGDALPLLLRGKADLAAIKEIKTFAVGIAPVEGLTLTGYYHMSDAKAIAQIKTLLEEKKVLSAKSQRVEVSPPEVAPWVTWQVRGDAAGMRDLLNLGREAKQK